VEYAKWSRGRLSACRRDIVSFAVVFAIYGRVHGLVTEAVRRPGIGVRRTRGAVSRDTVFSRFWEVGSFVWLIGRGPY